MTGAEVSRLVAVIAASWGAPAMTDARMEIYERMLADLPAREANSAIENLLCTCKFLPSIAEIREETFGLMHGERKTGAEAWGDVLGAVSRFGIYRQPVFADPVVAYAVRQFGWENICNSENAQADRARFIDLYEQLEKTSHKRELSAGLPANKALAESRKNPAAEIVGIVARRLTNGRR